MARHWRAGTSGSGNGLSRSRSLTRNIGSRRRGSPLLSRSAIASWCPPK